MFIGMRPSWRRVIKRRVITGNLLHCLRAADSVMNSSASRMQSRVYSGYAEAQPALAAKQQQSTLPRPHPRRLRILPVLTRRSWAWCGRCFIGGLRSVEALKFGRSDAAGGVLPGDWMFEGGRLLEGDDGVAGWCRGLRGERSDDLWR